MPPVSQYMGAAPPPQQPENYMQQPQASRRMSGGSQGSQRSVSVVNSRMIGTPQLQNQYSVASLQQGRSSQMPRAPTYREDGAYDDFADARHPSMASGQPQRADLVNNSPQGANRGPSQSNSQQQGRMSNIPAGNPQGPQDGGDPYAEHQYGSVVDSRIPRSQIYGMSQAGGSQAPSQYGQPEPPENPYYGSVVRTMRSQHMDNGNYSQQGGSQAGGSFSGEQPQPQSRRGSQLSGSGSAAGMPNQPQNPNEYIPSSRLYATNDNMQPPIDQNEPMIDQQPPQPVAPDMGEPGMTDGMQPPPPGVKRVVTTVKTTKTKKVVTGGEPPVDDQGLQDPNQMDPAYPVDQGYPAQPPQDQFYPDENQQQGGPGAAAQNNGSFGQGPDGYGNQQAPDRYGAYPGAPELYGSQRGSQVGAQVPGAYGSQAGSQRGSMGAGGQPRYGSQRGSQMSGGSGRPVEENPYYGSIVRSLQSDFMDGDSVGSQRGSQGSIRAGSRARSQGPGSQAGAPNARSQRGSQESLGARSQSASRGAGSQRASAGQPPEENSYYGSVVQSMRSQFMRGSAGGGSQQGSRAESFGAYGGQQSQAAQDPQPAGGEYDTAMASGEEPKYGSQPSYGSQNGVGMYGAKEGQTGQYIKIVTRQKGRL